MTPTFPTNGNTPPTRAKISSANSVFARQAAKPAGSRSELRRSVLRPASSSDTSLTVENITQRKEAEAQLESVNKKLQDNSRQAGMAEVATGVLHNVGNVLNSVNISSTLVAERLQKSGVVHLTKAVSLMQDHRADLGTFVTNDPQGKHLLDFFCQLSEHFNSEQAAVVKELAHLQKNIEHIKEIVSTQQAYASSAGFSEMIDPRELLEDALRIHPRRHHASRHQRREGIRRRSPGSGG